LSRRDRLIVARHEVPGVMRKKNGIKPRCIGGVADHVQQEYLAFLKRHELSCDDKYLWD